MTERPDVVTALTRKADPSPAESCIVRFHVMNRRTISLRAKLSAVALLPVLAFGCTGQIEPVATESRSPAGGRDAGRDAGGRDASEDAPEADGDNPAVITPDDDGGEVEVPQPPVVTPDDAGEELPPVPQDAGTKPDSSAPPVSNCPTGQPLATGLKVRQLAIYQTVKVSLYESGAWVTNTSVPVVSGKQSLLRVFVDTQSGYTKHAVRGVLTLSGAQGTTTLQSERSLSASSTDADDSSTFSFAVDPSQIAPDTQLSVQLEEPDCAAKGGQASDVRLPATGTRALGAEQVGKLKVVVLPISIGGLLPKTDDAELAKIKSALLAYYPVADVSVTVRATPFTGPSSLSGSDSNAWTSVLNSVLRERSNDRASADTYYFGLMQPATTFNTFCRTGCILGIAPQNTRISASSQGGLGAYFGDNQSAETIVHELGHAHGRGHAPCVKGGSIQGVDASFPDRAGGIMEWGWDSRTSKLISPTTYKDVMGYCSPNWISPYTYGALATRSQAVNSLAFVKQAELATPNAPWTNVLLHADGSVRWGGAYETRMPGGELESATVLDASGQALATIEITRLELSHVDDEIVYLPTPGASWARVVLRDRTLDLSQILPAL